VTNHEHHIELYDWCRDHPELDEVYWPGWEAVKTEHPVAYRNASFACEEADKISLGTCIRCPIDWKKYNCCDEGSLYREWLAEIDQQIRSELAAQIRDLPWRMR